MVKTPIKDMEWVVSNAKKWVILRGFFWIRDMKQVRPPLNFFSPYYLLITFLVLILSNVLFSFTTLALFLVVSSGHPLEVVNTGHWTRQSALNSYLCADGTAIEVLAITHLVTAPPRKLLDPPTCPARLWPNDEAMVGQ